MLSNDCHLISSSFQIDGIDNAAQKADMHRGNLNFLRFLQLQLRIAPLHKSSTIRYTVNIAYVNPHAEHKE